MKFEINRLIFQNALATVQRAISGKTTIPILSGVKLELTPNQLKLTGSDGDLSIEKIIKTDDIEADLIIESPGSIVLPARFLSDIVRKLPEKNVHFELQNTTQVEIKSGQAIFNINGFETIDYPNLPLVDEDNAIKIPVRLLQQVISETVFAASKQENRPILTGVHFTLDGNRLKAVATDSHRLSQRVLIIDDLDDDMDVVIPAKSLTELSRSFTDEEAEIQISVSSNQVLFKTEDLAFYSRLLDGAYPDTDRLIPTSFETEVIFNVRLLSSAIERASLFSHEGSNTNNVVKLAITSDKIMLYGNSPEVGQIEEQVTAEKIEGQDLNITFNPDYLKAALGAIKTDQVKIKFISPVRPFTLEPVADDIDFIQLITPVRTN